MTCVIHSALSAQATLMASSHREHWQDKTVLSCRCSWCELNWWRDKTVCDWKFQNNFVKPRNVVWTESCLVLTHFPIRMQRGYLLWRHLETGSRLVHKCIHTADKTKLFCLQYIENCLRLSRTQFTPSTRQHETVLSCWCSRCELAIRNQVILLDFSPHAAFKLAT